MSEETTVQADVNAESSASNDIDAQLTQMRDAETGKPQEETQKAEPPAEEVKVKEEKVVPLAALHEERNERKRLANELAQQRAMMEKVNQRLEVLMTPRQQAPDPTQDPVGYIDHRIQGLEQTIRPVLQSQQSQAESLQREAYAQQLKVAVSASAQEFMKQAPDLVEAGNFLNDMRTRELMLHGVPEAQARLRAVAEQDQALMTWAHQGVNPAQMAYDFAKARGYQTKAAQQQPTVQEKIAQQQKGVAASKSLGAGGANNAGKLTAQALAEMSPEDFAALSDRQWRQAMGG